MAHDIIRTHAPTPTRTPAGTGTRARCTCMMHDVPTCIYACARSFAMACSSRASSGSCTSCSRSPADATREPPPASMAFFAPQSIRKPCWKAAPRAATITCRSPAVQCDITTSVPSVLAATCSRLLACGGLDVCSACPRIQPLGVHSVRGIENTARLSRTAVEDSGPTAAGLRRAASAAVEQWCGIGRGSGSGHTASPPVLLLGASLSPVVDGTPMEPNLLLSASSALSIWLVVS